MTVKSKVILSSLLIVLLVSWGNGDKTAIQVFEMVRSNYSNHASVQYDVVFKQKFLDYEDTTVWNATCKLIKNTNDSLFGGIVWFQTNDGFERFYNDTNIFVIDHNTKSIIEFNGYGNEASVLTGNAAQNVIRVNFFNNDKLYEAIRDTSNIVCVETVANHHIITIKYHNNEGITDLIRKIWVQKENQTIDKVTVSLNVGKDHEYKEWQLSNIKFDNVKYSELKNEFVKKKERYSFKKYEPTPVENDKPLRNGVTAPEFFGVNILNNDSISFSRYKGKIVVLDFTYMACPHCLDVIPELNKLQNQFGLESLEVLAINSTDVSAKSQSKLRQFIRDKKIDYNTLLTSNSTDVSYNIKGYPTLYVIDAKGTVIYSQVGYIQNMSDTLSDIVKSLLNTK